MKSPMGKNLRNNKRTIASVFPLFYESEKM